MQDIPLSRDHPLDSGFGVSLVSVQCDGTTTIQRLDSGESFTAKPGEYFPGAFGTLGLQLLSASPESSEIVLRRKWSEPK